MGLLTRTEPREQPPEETAYQGQLWEYKTLNLNFKASIGFEDAFNKLGSQGWEFVAMAARDNVHRAVFKRPLGLGGRAVEADRFSE